MLLLFRGAELWKLPECFGLDVVQWQMEVGHKALAGEQNHGKGKSTGAMDGVNGTMFWFQKCLGRAQSCALLRAGCVRNLGCRVIFVRQLTTVCAAAGNVCWSCSEGWVRCAEVGFFQVYCPVWLPDDDRECRCTHSVVIAMKNLQIHFIGLRGTLAHGAVRFCKWFCLLISHSLCWTLADK